MTRPNFPSSQSDVAENIMREHDALRLKVRAIHSALAERDPNPGEIESLLREYLNALMVHFANEEDDGFFNKIGAQAPRFAAKAGRLSIEHRQLLHEAEELCQFAHNGCPSMPWWRELNSRCHNFNTRLMRHECEENQLLHDSRRVEIEACN